MAGFGLNFPVFSHRSLLRDTLPAATLLLVGSLFFFFTDTDIRWTKPWLEVNDWPHGDDFPWSMLYHLGTYPALIAVLSALAILLMGFRSAQWARFRKQSLYLVLLLALGPGIITNAVLKDHWGRPRPRDVTALGGQFPYERILTIDPSSPGKSFPCGHATMGFFFFAGYFLLRKSHPRWARAFVVFALFYGVIIGWARVVQGGHFPSDVLWAAGILWLCAALLAQWLKVEEIPAINPQFKPLSWRKLSVVFLLVPAVLFLVLLATPIDRKDNFSPTEPITLPAEVRLELPMGETVISSGDTLTLNARSHGFGLPGGGLKPVWKQTPNSEGGTEIEFKQRISGLQTELNQTLQLLVPADGISRVRVDQENGTVRLSLPEVPSSNGVPRRWDIELESGTVLIDPSSLPFSLRNEKEKAVDSDNPADDIRLKLGVGATFKIVE